MTIFTDGIIVRPGRNLLDDVVTGQFDAAEAAFDQAWFENPLQASRRISTLTEAQEGPLVRHAYKAWGVEELRGEPETPLLTAEEARRRVADSGLDIQIDDSGIREGALDILLERKREERQRQFVLENAPTSTMPIQLLAGFAASAMDPVNIAAGFVPVVGQARYSAMLANASTRAARFGVRARVGAVQGAVGTALVEPLILYASDQDQADYGISDSLLNIAFGTILGGGLHSVGGAVYDMRQASLLRGVIADAEAPRVTDPSPAREPSIERAVRIGDEDPMRALQVSLERAIAADRPRIQEVAHIQAREELYPVMRAQLEDVAAGRNRATGVMRAELREIDNRISRLDDSFRDRAKAFQGQRMTRKQAERAARDAIAEERGMLNERRAEIESAVDGNRQAELARAEIARLDRGEVPEQFKAAIEERAGQIVSGFELRDTARSRADRAPWEIRESALRSAIAQSMTGRQIDVEPVFDLSSPELRANAIERLKQPIARAIDPEGEQYSRQADEILNSPDGTDLASQRQLLDDEMALTREMTDQAGIDLEAQMREANAIEADANVYAAAYRAAAICQLRN